ncbi:hypothetical protein [Rhodococcus sp. IEGM 1379]|uniref:hypothetical protein n=1 Tax=Rhodococcus sp. IEGM 1379 TaxID=3047086 RepID=UPI0024B84923|nr:hypothetical protein [Rhodococcus sp. IEGM 1379]MDI9915070.1 hypothetical protein [Rhodococcus sp. IEGM 1379]
MKIRDVRSRSGIVPRLAVRWLMIAAATVFAFWPTWNYLWQSTVNGTAIGYVFVLPLLCLIAAVGIDLRRGPELPIHDRETDKIVGGIGLIVAIGMQALLMPRFAANYELMHIDVLAAWIFVWASAVLMFGLRPVNRYWVIWIVPMILAPLNYRTLATELGGTRFDYSIIMVLVASAATTIAVSRTWRRGFIGFIASTILGTTLVYYLIRAYPTAPLFAVQLLPAVGSALLVGGLFYFYERRGQSWKPFDRPLRKPSTATSNWTILVVFGAAILLFLTPLPAGNSAPVAVGPPPTSIDPRLIVPAGWHQTSTSEYDWPKRYFGSTSVLTRQTIEADTPDPSWDSQMRPRTVQIDVVQVRRPATLAVYPSNATYDLQNARVSPTVKVDLGRGVVAEMYTIVDDALLLTWSNLSFVWTRGDNAAQRVSLITVDNHEPDAYFPEPKPSMASNAANTLAVLLRGRTATEDNESQYKDLGMLEAVGRLIVEGQKW